MHTTCNSINSKSVIIAEFEWLFASQCESLSHMCMSFYNIWKSLSYIYCFIRWKSQCYSLVNKVA